VLGSHRGHELPISEVIITIVCSRVPHSPGQKSQRLPGAGSPGADLVGSSEQVDAEQDCNLEHDPYRHRRLAALDLPQGHQADPGALGQVG